MIGRNCDLNKIIYNNVWREEEYCYDGHTNHHVWTVEREMARHGSSCLSVCGLIMASCKMNREHGNYDNNNIQIALKSIKRTILEITQGDKKIINYVCSINNLVKS